MVENPTDEDWKDVRMALVSGRPISFQMDLYQPLYVTRPVVEMELFASLRPVAYSGGLQEAKQQMAAAPAPAYRMREKQDALKKAGQGRGAAPGMPTARSFMRGSDNSSMVNAV